MTTTRIKVTIEDALGFFDNYLETHVFNRKNTQTNRYFYKVPSAWLLDGQVPREVWERIYDHLYRGGWRPSGNADGSRYFIVKNEAHPMSSEDDAALAAEAVCYEIQEEGTFHKVSAEMFLKG